MKKILLILLLSVCINPFSFAGTMKELSITFDESIERYIENSQIWAKESGGHIEEMIVTDAADIISVETDVSENLIVRIEGKFDITRYDYETDIASTYNATCAGIYKGPSWEEIEFSCD